MVEPAIRLGLIGDNIAESRAPALHEIAGRLCGLPVNYELLQPRDSGGAFETVFEHCRQAGYRGLNITYPYKERVVRLVRPDSIVLAIGACNTVLFGPSGAEGYNSDYTGFIAGYRSAFGDAAPSRVAVVGAGGVGRAIVVALAALGADELRLFDLDSVKARALAEVVYAVQGQTSVRICGSADEAADGAEGLVNATPLGMGGISGCPFSYRLIAGRRWAFDAVYTPLNTAFMIAARAAGLTALSGYELFLYQGIDAFRIFTGFDVPEAFLRAALAAGTASAMPP